MVVHEAIRLHPRIQRRRTHEHESVALERLREGSGRVCLGRQIAEAARRAAKAFGLEFGLRRPMPRDQVVESAVTFGVTEPAQRPRVRDRRLDFATVPDDPLGDRRLCAEVGPRDLVGGEAAHEAEGQADPRVNREHGMAAHEEEDERVVALAREALAPLLERTRAVPALHTLGRAERRRVMDRVFAVRPGAPLPKLGLTRPDWAGAAAHAETLGLGALSRRLAERAAQ